MKERERERGVKDDIDRGVEAIVNEGWDRKDKKIKWIAMMPKKLPFSLHPQDSEEASASRFVP